MNKSGQTIPKIKTQARPAHSSFFHFGTGQLTLAVNNVQSCKETETVILQRAAAQPFTHSSQVDGVPSIVHEALRSPGQELDAGTRAYMEPRFGHDFSQVRIHADTKAAESARAVNALAYTVGRDVVFGQGQYKPDTSAGRQLVAHEMAHLVQQGANSPAAVVQRFTDFNFGVLPEGWEPGTPFSGPRRTGTTPASVTAPSFSHSAAASYARTWALSRNPQYVSYPTDCTNFVSQAMLAGGWTMVGGSVFDRADDDVWWYGRSVWSDASYTWAGAQNFANFVASSGRGTRAGSEMDLQEGDVLQMQFDGSSHIGHSMVVTGKTDSDLLLSYHTSDHLDEPLSSIRSRSPGAVFIPWRIL